MNQENFQLGGTENNGPLSTLIIGFKNLAKLKASAIRNTFQC